MPKEVLKLHSLEILLSSGCSVEFLWLESSNLYEFRDKDGCVVSSGIVNLNLDWGTHRICASCTAFFEYYRFGTRFGTTVK